MFLVCSTARWMGPVQAVSMIAEKFADAIEKLIAAPPRDEGLSDGVIIAWLEEAADAQRGELR
jgi:hypothetical protein